VEIDNLDKKLLTLLKENSKRSLNLLEEELDKRSSTIHSRIKKLEQKEIIKNYTINIDNKKIGFPLVAYIMLTFDKTETDSSQEDIARKIASLERVISVDIIAGEYDILLKVRSKNIEDLGQFVTKHLKEIDGVGNTRTFVSLNIIKEESDQPFLISALIEDN